MPDLNDVKKWEKTFFVIQNWKDQALHDEIEWHKAKLNPKLTDDRLNDFRAGWEAGYREAVIVLKLHNMIKY
jgi:hypothetical protein